MRLQHAFIRLPLHFDAAVMRAEIDALPAEAWKAHPQGFRGNSAMPLVARNGDANDDATSGRMAPTPWLQHLPSIITALAALDTPIGRARLMRIDGVSEAPRHTDLDYYWRARHRIHLPVTTNECVAFECGDDCVNMAAGECWIFDTTRLHRVTNPEPTTRIHLVVDSVGSRAFDQLIRSAEAPRLVSCSGPAAPGDLRYEAHNRPPVMSPHELASIAEELLGMFRADGLDPAWIEGLSSCAEAHLSDWTDAWYRNTSPQHKPAVFEELRQRFEREVTRAGAAPGFRGLSALEWIQRWLIEPTIAPATERTPSPAVGSGDTPPGEPVPGHLTQPASSHTDSLPALLEFLGGSLAVTTYASNHLMLLRSRDGQLQTHFRYFPAPMGVAIGPEGLALGSNTAIWRFRNATEASACIEPAPDAVFVPVTQHVTGDVRVHELAWGNDGLWFVNTRFSCLCRVDGTNSFVPDWRPAFAADIREEDACHLNGLAMRNGAPRWVTALGATASAGGWRPRKADGGVIVDVSDDAVIASGLCMPHSPRWHEGRLWVLDSGRGEVCVVDPATGTRDGVAQVPGFARGLALVGRYAFVGVSMVRSSAWFGDLPITRSEATRQCGVWAVDTQTGATVAWLQFAQGVEEIFDVQWLPGLRWPDVLEASDTLAQNTFLLPG